MNVECGDLLNAHKNVNLTDSESVWRRVWWSIEKDGTYIVADVIVSGRK